MGGQAILLLLLAAVGCLSHSIHKRQTFFQDIVRQRSLGNNGISQCPCVMHPESRQCVVYDSRYQASTIEEAILTFTDLTRDGFEPFPVNSATFTCQSVECQHCFGFLYYRLIDIGFIAANFRPHSPLLPRNQLNPSFCPRYQFPLPHIVPPPPVIPDYVRKLISAGMRYWQSGALRALPRHFFNRDRFQPGPRPPFVPRPPIPFPPRSQQRPSPQQRPPPQQRPQQPSRQGGNTNGMVWNGFTRRWEQPQRQLQQPQQPQQPQQIQWQNQPRVGQNNNRLVWNSQTRRWEDAGQNVLQQARQWTQQVQQQPQQTAQQQWTQRSQWPQQAQTWPQQTQQQSQSWAQQPQNWAQQTQQQVQQPQWGQTQVQQPQLQVQSNQQLQWAQQPTQQSWAAQQSQWAGQQQGSQWNDPQFQQQSQWPSQQPVQEGLIHSALQQTHQVINPLAQQVANPFQGSFQGSQGSQSGGQGGQIGGQIGGQTSVVGSLFGGILGRKKREVDPLIGRKFTIACVRRGETTTEDGEFLSLCGTCWTWRQLPEDYFPRILNELNCQENDYCLSGWGQCSQQFRNVDVLRRQDGRWVPTVLTTSTSCTCRVHVGSEIHGLVVGDKQKVE